MNAGNRSGTIILRAGLYPDAETVAAATEAPPLAQAVRRIDLPPPGAHDDAWDAILADILKAEKIVTL